MGKYAEQRDRSKFDILTVEVDVYKARGLSWGSPGTAEMILGEEMDVFWSLKHVFLSLGALSAYEEVYGLDPALEAEKVALEHLKAVLEPIVKAKSWSDWNTAKSYHTTGKTHIKPPSVMSGGSASATGD